MLKIKKIKKKDLESESVKSIKEKIENKEEEEDKQQGKKKKRKGFATTKTFGIL